MVYAACESLDVTPVHSRALAKSVYVCDYLVEFLRGNLQELFLYGESDTQPDYVPGWGDCLAHSQGKSKIGKEVHSVVEIGYRLVERDCIYSDDMRAPKGIAMSR